MFVGKEELCFIQILKHQISCSTGMERKQKESTLNDLHYITLLSCLKMRGTDCSQVKMSLLKTTPFVQFSQEVALCSCSAAWVV